MRDPKEIVDCIDSLVVVVIGILLVPIGVSLAPIGHVLVSPDSGLDPSCTVTSLEPLAIVAWMVIVFIYGATIMSKIVQARYTRPSTNPPLKIKMYTCVAWICLALACMLSMVIVILSLEVKLQKLTCFPEWVLVTVIITTTLVGLGFLQLSYVLFGEALSDDAPAAASTTALDGISQTEPDTASTVAPPPIRSTTAIAAPHSASSAASSSPTLLLPRFRFTL